MDKYIEKINSIEDLKYFLIEKTNDGFLDYPHLYKCVFKTREYPFLNEYIEEYLKVNPDVINWLIKDGNWSALMSASRNSMTFSTNETVKILLKYGADVNLQEEKGWTSLMLASRNSNSESSEKTVKILLEHDADVNLQNNDGQTALIMASCNSNSESTEGTVKMLLEHNADVNLQNNDGQTALILASYNSNSKSSEKTVKMLLENNADVNLQNINGHTALMLAVKNSKTTSSIGTVRILLENKSDMYIQTKAGHNAFIIAAILSKETSSVDTVRLLLEFGFDPNYIYQNTKIITVLYNNYLDNTIDAEILGLLISFGAKLSDLPDDKNLKKILKEKGYLKSNSQNIINYLNRDDIKLYMSTCQICFEDNVRISECEKEHKICFNCLNKLRHFKCEFCYPRT